MSKIKNISVEVLAQKAHKENMRRVHVTSKKDKLFCVNDLYTIIEDIKKKIVKQSKNSSDYEIYVIPHDEKYTKYGGWYVGKWSPLNENGFYIWSPKLYTAFEKIVSNTETDEFYTDELYDQFYLTIKKKKSLLFQHSVFNKVGNGKYNDCVFEFLEQLYIPVPFTKESLKSFCGVGRKDKILLSDFKKIESHIKYKDCRFLVSSDDISNSYLSGKTDYKYTFNAINKDGHLVISKDYNSHSLSTSETEKSICMYHDDLIEDTKVTLYNSKGYYTISTYAFFGLLRQNQNSSKCKQLFIRVKSKELHKEYEQFMKDAVIIKRESKGLINMFKTGSFYTTMLDVLYKKTNHIEFESLPLSEQIFLHYSYIGAIMTCKKEYKGNCYKYDIRSFYGYIMSNHKNQYPFKSGSFITLSKDEFNSVEFYKFGIYRCKVLGKCDYFVFSDNNYYTHVDLEEAKKFGLIVNIICDGQPNFLHYDKSCLTSGYHLFKPLITELYNIKLKFPDCKTIKVLLTLVSGLLGERLKVSKTVNVNDELDLTSFENLTMRPFEDTIKYTGIDISSQIFKHDYARASPYINSYGRREIIHQIGKDNLCNVIRIQTDGWMLSEKPKVEYKFSDDMGGIKFEGYYKNIRINNLNNVDDLEKNIKLIGKNKITCDNFVFTE